MKSSLKLFVITFVVLSLLMHYKEFLSHPIVHIKNLSIAGAYGFGSFHPIIFTAIIFVLLLVIKAILKILRVIK